MPRKPQWDDWRCYRCNRWLPASDRRHEHLTPAGYTLSVCEVCAAPSSQKVGERTVEDVA